MGYVVMVTAPPTAVGILLFEQPDAGAHRCRKAFRPTKPQMSCEQAVHDLAGVEDDGLAAGFTVMSGKGAIRMLEGELPVYHTMCAADQIGALRALAESMKVSTR